MKHILIEKYIPVQGSSNYKMKLEILFVCTTYVLLSNYSSFVTIIDNKTEKDYYIKLENYKYYPKLDEYSNDLFYNKNVQIFYDYSIEYMLLFCSEFNLKEKLYNNSMIYDNIISVFIYINSYLANKNKGDGIKMTKQTIEHLRNYAYQL